MPVEAPAKVPCPSAEELRRLLRGKLPDDRQDTLTSHVEDCTNCQSSLELLADGDTNLSGVVKHLDQSGPSKDSAMWKALADVENALTAEFPAAEKKPADKKLDFLQPLRLPGKIGRLGHFQVIRELGRGGMGIVLQAWDPTLEREVAVKVLDPQLQKNDVARQRFTREARAAAAVTHENIVAVHQVNEDEFSKLPYFVMQLVVGETLEQRLQREKKLGVEPLVKIAWQAAQGLAAAHAAGLIHRDIKPGNILLEAGTDKAKLTDFGLARAAEDLKLTRTGFVAGTPLYMAPEQARGEEADARADLFSLGAVMYESLAGKPPFEGATPLAVLRRVADEAHPRLGRINTDVPDWLEDVIDELLEKDPDRRLPSAELLAKRLADNAANTCTTATPVECSVARTASRLTGARRKSALTTALVLGLPFVIGALAGALGAFQFIPPKEVLVEVPVHSAAVPNTESPAPRGPEPLRTLLAGSGPVWSIAITADSQHVLAGREDGGIIMWNLATGDKELTKDNAHDGPIWAVDFAPDGKTALTASDDGTVKIWDVSGAAVLLETLKHPTSVRSAAFDNTGKRVVSGDRAGMVRVWQLGEEKPAHELLHGGTVTSVAFEPINGVTVVSASTNKVVLLWELRTERSVSFTEHKGPVYSVAFSNDGTAIASASWDRTVKVWEARNGHIISTIKAPDEAIASVAFAGCGKMLATAGQDGDVKVWDIDSGVELNRFSRHKGTVHAVKFVPNCHTLLSGGRDGTIQVWKVK